MRTQNISRSGTEEAIEKVNSEVNSVNDIEINPLFNTLEKTKTSSPLSDQGKNSLIEFLNNI